jgi:hypothetical protein
MLSETLGGASAAFEEVVNWAPIDHLAGIFMEQAFDTTMLGQPQCHGVYLFQVDTRDDERLEQLGTASALIDFYES